MQDDNQSLLKAAAAAGDLDCRTVVFMLRQIARNKNKEDVHEAAKIILNIADNGGDPEIQYQAGLLFSQGKVIIKDLAAAKQCFKQALTKGHLSAGIHLANICLNENDYTEAHKALGILVRMKSPWGTFRLSECYRHGLGFKQDPEAARKWAHRAGEYAIAQIQAESDRAQTEAAVPQQSPQKLLSSFRRFLARRDPT